MTIEPTRKGIVLRQKDCEALVQPVSFVDRDVIHLYWEKDVEARFCEGHLILIKPKDLKPKNTQ